MIDKKNLIIYTDIGDDIDDTLAIRFANKSPDINSMIIVLNTHNIEKRITAWEHIKSYISKPHAVILWNDFDCDMQLSTLLETDKMYHILGIWPLTECSHHIREQIVPHKNIASITIQAGILPQQNWWLLNTESRNLKTDLSAAQFFDSSFLEYHIPINWIGKYAAYEIGLSKERIHNLASSDNSWFGEHIEQQAYHRQQIFSQKNPRKYNEIYWSHPDIISFPYDFIALISILYPSDYNWENYDGYKVIGHKPGEWLKEEVFWLLDHQNIKQFT